MSWMDVAARAAKKYGLPVQYFVNQMGQEAHGEDLTSPAGAQGPAQIMPQTAEGWGLSPAEVHNIHSAYDAAAKHMAQYMHQFGSFRDALVAYNAGPGRVGQSLPAETQNYIQTIMRGGHDATGGGGGGQPQASPTPATQAGAAIANPIDAIAGLTQANPQNPFADQMQKGWDLLSSIWEQQHPQPDTSIQGSPITPADNSGGGVPRVPGGLNKAISKDLHEAFYDPIGGYDEGHSIGAIGGHSDHMHFGGNPDAVAAIVRKAQSPRWGLTVREYGPVDKVDPVHTDNSWHYRFGNRGAADISGDPDKMANFFKRILRRAGWS